MRQYIHKITKDMSELVRTYFCNVKANGSNHVEVVTYMYT